MLCGPENTACCGPDAACCNTAANKFQLSVMTNLTHPGIPLPPPIATTKTIQVVAETTSARNSNAGPGGSGSLSTDPNSNPSSNPNESLKIGLGVGLPLGLFFAVAVGYIIWDRLQKRAANNKDAAMLQQELEQEQQQQQYIHQAGGGGGVGSDTSLKPGVWSSPSMAQTWYTSEMAMAAAAAASAGGKWPPPSHMSPYPLEMPTELERAELWEGSNVSHARLQNSGTGREGA